MLLLVNMNIEQKIVKIIEELYCTEFCGRLEVEPLFDYCPSPCGEETACSISGYTLKLWYSNDNVPPISITKFTNSDEQFLIFVKEWLRKMRLNQVRHYKSYTIDPDGQK